MVRLSCKEKYLAIFVGCEISDLPAMPLNFNAITKQCPAQKIEMYLGDYHIQSGAVRLYNLMNILLQVLSTIKSKEMKAIYNESGKNQGF